jgi:hypothetical protein
MGAVTKVNPLYHDNTNGALDSLNIRKIQYFSNKTLTFFEVDFGADARPELGPNEAIQAVENIVRQYAIIVIRGALQSDNQTMTFVVEQTNESLDWDGAGAETLVEQIEDEIIALGDDYGDNDFDMRNVTCTVNTTVSLA